MELLSSGRITYLCTVARDSTKALTDTDISKPCKNKIKVEAQKIEDIFLPKDNAGYQIIVTNEGRNQLHNVMVLDSLDDGNLCYVDGSATLIVGTTWQHIKPVSTRPLKFNLPNLNANEKAHLTYFCLSQG